MLVEGRAPIPGTGWGCALCGLPFDGAIAVLCDDCAEHRPDLPVMICVGYPKDDKRASCFTLSPDLFAHDYTKHTSERFHG